jgi:biopolymer transport protein ExbB
MISILFEKGGILIYPLLAFSVISAAVIIEKCHSIRKITVSRKFYEGIVSAAGKNDKAAIASFMDSSPKNRQKNLSSDIIENAISGRYRSQKEASPAVSSLMLESVSGIHILDLVGKISPMTGLTGTVIGLARAFQDVSVSGRTGDAALLAGGIWEAMITTIAGLLIAIPAIIASHLLRSSFKKHFARLRHCIEALLPAEK